MNRFPLLALALCLSSSCKPEKPTLDVKGASVDEADLDGVTVDVAVVVNNPNSFPIFADAIDVTASLEKKPLATATLKKRVSVGAKSSTAVTVPVRFRYSEVGLAAQAAAKKVDWRYDVAGAVSLAPIDAVVVTLPFATDGTIEAPRLPAVSFGKARLSDVTTSSVTVAVPVVIENPNAFALPGGSLRGNAIVGDAPAMRLSEAVPSVPKRGKLTVVLQQKVPLSALGKAALDVAAGKGVDVVVDAAASFGSHEVSLKKATLTLAR